MTSNASLMLLRVGVAFAFLYVAVSMSINPDNWIGYYPDFLLNMVAEKILTTSSAIFHTVIALWILFSRRIFIPSVLASLGLIAIIAFNYTQMNTLFRDVTILTATLALAIEGWQHEVWGLGHRSEAHYPEAN